MRFSALTPAPLLAAALLAAAGAAAQPASPLDKGSGGSVPALSSSKGQAYPVKPVRMIVPFVRGRRTGSRRGGWRWGGDGARPPALWHRVLQRLAIALVASASLAAGTSFAQSYPLKPVKLIVPFVPGGNTDIIARIVAPEMSKALGQQLVIDNRGGAGSVIGTEAAAKSPPDGYTLLMVSAAHTINPAMAKKLPYDSIRDFAPITVVADVPTAFAVHPLLPVKNVKEFIALARARPGQLNYSTAGRGTVGHLSAELLSSMAKIKMVHVPYKGTGQSITDLIAGHVQLQFSSMPAVINHSRSGKLRLLAQTGAKRSAAASDIPTMVESGVPGFIVSSGFGLLAPAGTPRPIIDRVHGALVKAINEPSVRNNLSGQGAEPVGNTPEAYDAFNRAEIAKWIKVVREAGIEPE